jgi:hypothetical protein
MVRNACFVKNTHHATRTTLQQHSIPDRQEILQQLFPMLRQNRFGMELHAKGGMLFVL